MSDLEKLKQLLQEYRQREAEYLQDLDHYRSLVEGAPDWIYELDAEERYVYSGPQVAEILGYLPAEILGKTPYELMPPSEAQRVAALVQPLIIQGQPLSEFENTMRHKDGHEVVIQSTARLLFFPDGTLKGVRGIDRDVTGRRVVEQLLRLQEKRLRQIIDLVPHFIFAKDIEGRFILANQAVAEVYGTSVDQLIGLSDADFAQSQEEVDHFRADDLAVISSGIPKLIEDEIITDSQGQQRWLSTTKIPFTFSGASLPSVLGVSVDLTKQKRVEAALRESEQRFRSLYENLSEGVALYELIQNAAGEPSDYRVVDVNPAFCRILHIPREEAVGHSAADLYQEPRAPFLEILASVAATGAAATLEAYYQPLDRHFFVSAFSAKGGEFATIFFDITDRKRAELELEQRVAERSEELQKAVRQLQENERLVSIGTLAAGIAHELNNPIGIILLMIQDLQRNLKSESSPDALLTELQSLEGETRRCAAIVHSVLQFARQEGTAHTLAALPSVIAAAIQAVQPLAEERQVKIDSRLPEKLPQVRINQVEIQQVFVNLLENALQASKAADHVKIRARLSTKGLAVTISDAGCGIPPDQVSRIFDPFYTTRRAQGGTGLGLSISHGIVRGHGGSLEVSSTVGAGTTITVKLPIAEAGDGP